MGNMFGQHVMILTAGHDRMLGLDAAWLTGVGFNIINIAALAAILY